MVNGRKLGAALTAALMCLGLSAVFTGAHSQNQNMNSNMNMNKNMKMSSSMDSKFATMAASGGMAEVEMARLALTKSSSDSVKQYAQKMIDDHTAANEELMQIASAKSMTLPTAPDPKMQMMMAKMDKLSGMAFDHEYIKTAGVKAHMDMEKLFRDESLKGKDAELKGFAAKTLPTVQMHLQMARDMDKMMMDMKSNSNSNMNHNSNTSN